MVSNRTPDGLLFTVPGQEDYLSTDKHQHGGVPTTDEDDSSWALSRDDEHDFFRWSVVNGQLDTEQNLWSLRRDVHDRLARLGTAEEVVALFQVRANDEDVWHGHPRGHRGTDDYPTISLLRLWKNARQIRPTEYKRMVDGKIP